ncbi:hypothetical protein D5086_032635 [Populus alba]|uniref:Uncharacterized protein n=1 Tax=Populus alba TaxID=43335 RepID=A0ACC4AEK3_POPAL
MLRLPTLLHSAEPACLHSGINLPASTRHSEMTTFQYIWPHYLEHVMSERFTRRSQSDARNRNRPIHGSVTTLTGGSVSFSTHTKWMATSLGREPSPMELFMETHMRCQNCQKGAQQFVDNRAKHFMETYNNRLRERYGDDPLTHPEFDPNLWMEVGSLGGPDKNQVYGFFNTTADNSPSAHSASTVGSSQSISSSQSKEFVVLQQHTSQLTEKYRAPNRSTHNSKRLMKQSLHNKKRLMNSFAK